MSEVDLLLGVRDDLRQGALRFRLNEQGPFLATEESGVPSHRRTHPGMTETDITPLCRALFATHRRIAPGRPVAPDTIA
jgi:hypothetical protein